MTSSCCRKLKLIPRNFHGTLQEIFLFQTAYFTKLEKIIGLFLWSIQNKANFPLSQKTITSLPMNTLRVRFGFSLEKGLTLQKHPRICFYPSGRPTKPHHCLVAMVTQAHKTACQVLPSYKSQEVTLEIQVQEGCCKTAA